MSLIVSDEQLLVERADLLMLEIAENHGHEKFNAFTSMQLFGYPLIDEIESE